MGHAGQTRLGLTCRALVLHQHWELAMAGLHGLACSHAVAAAGRYAQMRLASQ